MIIQLFLNRLELTSDDITKGDIVVIVDVLRASTTIITALKNGCRSVIPIAEVEEAQKLANLASRHDTLLCGERNGRKIPGFDLSNSPLEFRVEIVNNKRIILTTTNGAKLFRYVELASSGIVCSFVNVESVCQFLKKSKQNVVILCAGNYDRFSLEDTVCGGMVVEKLIENNKGKFELNDGAVAAQILYQRYSFQILEMLYQSSHGKRLISIGQEADLKYCGSVNSIPLIPVLKGGEVVRSDS